MSREEPVTGAEARRVAEDALAAGLADDPFARAHGRFLDPLRVVSPDGTAAGWMVPIAFDGRLLGFVQVQGNGAFRRYASFQRRPGAVETCPALASWTDPVAIRDRARDVVDADARLSEPVLTYDRSPDRLVWSLTSVGTDGACTRIHVAGDLVWIVDRHD